MIFKNFDCKQWRKRMTSEHGQRLKLHVLLIMFMKLLKFAFRSKINIHVKNKTIPLRTRWKYRSRSQIRPETGVRQSMSRSTGAASEISVKFLIQSILINSLNIKIQYMT